MCVPYSSRLALFKMLEVSRSGKVKLVRWHYSSVMVFFAARCLWSSCFVPPPLFILFVTLKKKSERICKGTWKKTLLGFCWYTPSFGIVFFSSFFFSFLHCPFSFLSLLWRRISIFKGRSSRGFRVTGQVKFCG